MPYRSTVDARTPVRTLSSAMKGVSSPTYTPTTTRPAQVGASSVRSGGSGTNKPAVQPITSRSIAAPKMVHPTRSSDSSSSSNTMTSALTGALTGALLDAFRRKLFEKQDPAPIEKRDTTTKKPTTGNDTPSGPPNIYGDNAKAYDANGNLKPGYELDENNNPVWVGIRSVASPDGAYDDEGNLMPGWELDEYNNPVWVGGTQNGGGDLNLDDLNLDPEGYYTEPEFSLEDYFSGLNLDNFNLDDYELYKNGGNVHHKDDAYSFADGGETLSDTFNTDAYLELNPDVLTGIEDYRAKLAKAGRPDESPAELARKHYLLHGKTEGRRAVYRSAPVTSQTANVASQPTTRSDSSSTAATQTRADGAVYVLPSHTKPFNAQEYLAHNPDAARYIQEHLSEFGGDVAKGALEHARKYGVSEKRLTDTGAVYDRNFDAAAYLKNNKDVSDYINANLAMFGNDPNRGALEHYLKFGQAEKRAAPVRGGLNSTTNTGGGSGDSTTDNEVEFGVIPPRTTNFGPGMTGGRTGTGNVVVPYEEYAQPMAEYTPDERLYADLGVSNYLPEEPAMADGGSTHYTFGRVIDPAENLGLNMKQGGLSQAHTVHSHHANPVINNRIDFKQGAAVNGKGDGQSDEIPAWLADGEYVMDAELVSMLGNGSNKAGAKILDEFREKIRAHKRGAPLDKIPPKAKSPLNYLKEVLNG